MNEYLTIDLEEFKEVFNSLTKGNYELYYSSEYINSEYVFIYQFKKNNDLEIHVFSSISRVNNKSKSSGKDAIRIMLYSNNFGTYIGGKKRINRVLNWDKRLKKRFIELGESAPHYKCDCGGYLVLRKSKKNKFYGCVNYPKCKNTKNHI